MLFPQQDSRFNQEIDKKTGYHTRSILCMPIRDHYHGEVCHLRRGTLLADKGRHPHIFKSKTRLAGSWCSFQSNLSGSAPLTGALVSKTACHYLCVVFEFPKYHIKVEFGVNWFHLFALRMLHLILKSSFLHQTNSRFSNSTQKWWWQKATFFNPYGFIWFWQWILCLFTYIFFTLIDYWRCSSYK